jgi:hypothetical protein
MALERASMGESCPGPGAMKNWRQPAVTKASKTIPRKMMFIETPTSPTVGSDELTL